MKHSVLPALGGLALLLAGSCNKHYDTLAPLLPGTEYYPAAAGNYRVYQVVDTVWRTYVPTAVAYQRREQLVATAPDAVGNPVYRLETARRASAADVWTPDSVWQLDADARRVVLTRGNRRTVELVFPVRDTASWNQSAYANTATAPLVTDHNRRYVPGRNAQPFDAPAVAAAPARHYATTLSVETIGAAAAADICDPRGYVQVFAAGVGPVYQYGYSKSFQVPGAGNCDPTLGPIAGSSHTEVLLEAGP